MGIKPSFSVCKKELQKGFMIFQKEVIKMVSESQNTSNSMNKETWLRIVVGRLGNAGNLT